MFKIFPCGANKIPLIRGWQEAATMDNETIQLWQNTFKDKLKYWGVPTGPANGILALDVDVKGDNGFETLKKLQVPSTMFQKTPSGGAHYLYKYPNDGKQYGNKVKFLPGLDTRGVGGYILYYGTDQTPLADPPSWLLQDTGKVVQPIVGSPIQVAPEIAINIIQTSLDAIREAPEKESNNVLNIEAFKVGQLCASGAVTRQYAEEALLRAALERGKSVYESKATIASGLDGGARKPLTSPFGEASPVVTLTIPPPPVVERYTPVNFTRADLTNTSALRKPQLFEHWSTEDISITTADGGTGKTTLKLFEAICLALGHGFLGFQCKQRGKTLFITGEDTAAKLGAMLGQILRQMGMLENPIYNDAVECVLASIVVKKDADLCLITKDRSGFMHMNADAIRKVTEAIDDIQPKMVVFDPISSFWGSENALNDMAKAVTKFMGLIAERGVNVEMINHMGKVSSSQKDMTQFAGRGGTGLPSHSRVSRVLRQVFDEEYTELTNEQLAENQSAMMCNVNKFSDGSPLYNKPFLILREGFLFTRKDLSDNKVREAQQNATDTERVFVFIKESRLAGKYPTEKIVIAAFAAGFSGNPIPGERIKRAMQMLMFQGHMGEKVKSVENPDMSVKEKALVIVDQEGKEI